VEWLRRGIQRYSHLKLQEEPKSPEPIGSQRQKPGATVENSGYSTLAATEKVKCEYHHETEHSEDAAGSLLIAHTRD
jgi:hypothetical protein